MHLGREALTLLLVPAIVLIERRPELRHKRHQVEQDRAEQDEERAGRGRRRRRCIEVQFFEVFALHR